MPFCEECARYFAPSAMRSDGSCPQCGRVLDAPSYSAKNLDLHELADAKAPWHFKLLVVALCLYLGWRIVDLFV
ncbi:MAG: hypothetical protein ACKO36_06980 [Actinomycetota bacterium]|nr:hypothetical protein [Actinomycetota bacterium]